MITDRVKKPYIPVELYAMTLDEIAEATGMTKKNVAMCIQHALRKLAKQPEQFRDLLELAAHRQQIVAEKNANKESA